MTTVGIFYYDTRHLLKNKNAHIMVNDSRSPIPQVQEKKKWYTARDVKRYDHVRRLHHTTGQLINRILNAVDNNMLQNLPTLQEDVRMAEDIYGPSVTHLQGEKVRHKIHHVEPIMVPKFPKVILHKYKKVTLCCDLMQIDGISFLNTKIQHIIFLQELWLKIEK